MSLIDTRRNQMFPVLSALQIETARRFASGAAQRFAPGEVIDGHEIMCKIAPTDNSAPSEACRDWPANVVVGHTRVRVTYWHATKRALKGQDVPVTDEIRTLETSAAHSSGSVVNNSG
jgi:hypothetical protein